MKCTGNACSTARLMSSSRSLRPAQRTGTSLGWRILSCISQSLLVYFSVICAFVFRATCLNQRERRRRKETNKSNKKNKKKEFWQLCCEISPLHNHVCFTALARVHSNMLTETLHTLNTELLGAPIGGSRTPIGECLPEKKHGIGEVTDRPPPRPHGGPAHMAHRSRVRVQTGGGLMPRYTVCNRPTKP